MEIGPPALYNDSAPEQLGVLLRAAAAEQLLIHELMNTALVAGENEREGEDSSLSNL
jgi:hypothetical protein